ncbi:hypothetical protein PHLCEN_2v3248 [Hermanssonia centrifuga]|uniref:Uncharacterized protein n=1 Tax=Hermanssonia centrifuga TaxID=98765 RepID=A0A2R6QXI6_9APHY|nr:hypothetical protein PHLCEN_2v3248 [Hermanssonia centrifuga]
MHSILLTMNIAQVVFNTVPSLQVVSPVLNLIETPSFTPILISRFLLNLRQLGEPEDEIQSRFNSQFSISGFRVPTLEGIVGNMGADLDHGPAEEVDDEAGEADIDGGDAEVAAICDIAEGSREPVMEQIYEIQEVGFIRKIYLCYAARCREHSICSSNRKVPSL